MDLGELRELVPVAQDEVLEERAYQAEIQSLEAPRNELATRLGTVVDYLTSICLEFDGSYDFYVRLAEVPEDVIDETNEVRPAGYIGVNIQAIAVDERRDKSFRSAIVSDAKKLAYVLDYYFIADDDISQPAGKRRASCTAMGSETTLGDEDSPKGRKAYGSDRMGIEELPPTYSYTAEDAGHLKKYVAEYLPARTDQIEELEKSVENIRVALEDPSLNPWVAEKRAISERAARVVAMEAEDVDSQAVHRRGKLGRLKGAQVVRWPRRGDA